MTSFGWQRSRSLGKDCQYRWELARLKMLLNLLFPRRRRRRLPSSRIVVSSYLPHPPLPPLPPRSLYFMTFNIVATNFNFARHLLLILLLCACRTNANKYHQPNQHHPTPSTTPTCYVQRTLTPSARGEESSMDFICHPLLTFSSFSSSSSSKVKSSCMLAGWKAHPVIHIINYIISLHPQ